VDTITPGEHRLLHDDDRTREYPGFVPDVGNPEDQEGLTVLIVGPEISERSEQQ
jgi:cell division septation protein DedD